MSAPPPSLVARVTTPQDKTSSAHTEQMVQNARPPRPLAPGPWGRVQPPKQEYSFPLPCRSHAESEGFRGTPFKPPLSGGSRRGAHILQNAHCPRLNLPSDSAARSQLPRGPGLGPGTRSSGPTAHTPQQRPPRGLNTGTA